MAIMVLRGTLNIFSRDGFGRNTEIKGAKGGYVLEEMIESPNVTSLISR